MRLDFGAAPGGIAQVAYFVADIEAAMTQYTRHLGVGPWFVRGPFTPPEGLLRGRPHSPTFTLARGFTGHTMVELIAQHDDGPSVYHEGPGPRQYGFHHWGVMSRDFDGDLERYARLGFPEAFSDRLPSGSRVVYVDSWRFNPTADRIRTLSALVREGYADRIHLSQDAACFYDFMVHNPFFEGEKPDYLFITHEVMPLLADAGVTTDVVEQMMVTNPRTFFARGRLERLS